MEPRRGLDYPLVVDTSRVWAEIDLDALGHNLGWIRRRVGPGPALILVVKADAYGHGAVAVAHHALASGVAALGVGTSAEALALRRAGIRSPILVLGTIVDGEVSDCLEHGVEIGLHSTDRARALDRAARAAGRTVRVHLNVDTGMGRLGVLPRRAAAVLRVVQRAARVELAGIMTHLAAVDEADASASAQLETFRRTLAGLRRAGLVPEGTWIHAANSLAILRGQGLEFDAVRPGLAAYGIAPGAHRALDGLRPVLSWRTQVVFLKDLPRGAAVGYGGTWRAKRRTRVATLPVGYNDGLPWGTGNRGHVLVRGCRAPLVGRVSMDYTTVDVSDIPGVEVGAQVTLLGGDGDERFGGRRPGAGGGDDPPRGDLPRGSAGRAASTAAAKPPPPPPSPP